MAVTVTVREEPPGRSIVLDSDQTRLFLNELDRVTGCWLFNLIKPIISNLFSHPDRDPMIQADCVIDVDRNGHITQYELLSGVVLRKKGSRMQHQFYFGLLILQWLG